MGNAGPLTSASAKLPNWPLVTRHSKVGRFSRQNRTSQKGNITYVKEPDRSLIFGIEFDRFEELAPGVRPARCVDDSGSADMIVSSVIVTLQDALEVAQEPFGSFPFATHSKVEDHRSSRPAVLPKVGLVVFPSAIVHLDIHRSFVRLNIIAL
jgi:hypothetical protein